MKISITGLMPFCGLIVMLHACNNATPNEPIKTDSPVNNSTSPTPAAEKPEPSAGPLVSFKVNGIDANSKPRTGDSDEAMGMFNYQTQQLVLGLYGDDPKQPHRGWINFGIDQFKLTTGSFNASAKPLQSISFSRYGTENAGEEVMYNGKEFQLEIEKLDKDPTSERYLASGRFSATLEIKPEYKFQNKALYEKSDKTILITAGKFEKIPILTLGKKS